MALRRLHCREFDDDDDNPGGIQIFTIDELLKVGAQTGLIPEETDQAGNKGYKPKTIPKSLW